MKLNIYYITGIDIMSIQNSLCNNIKRKSAFLIALLFSTSISSIAMESTQVMPDNFDDSSNDLEILHEYARTHYNEQELKERCEVEEGYKKRIAEMDAQLASQTMENQLVRIKLQIMETQLASMRLQISATEDQLAAQYNSKNIFIEIENGNLENIKVIIENNPALINEKNKYSSITPLGSAINHDQIEIAKYLCDIYPQAVFEVGHNNEPCLYTAAKKGLYPFVRHILENHQNIFTDESINEFFQTHGTIEMIKGIGIFCFNQNDVFFNKILNIVSLNQQVDVLEYLMQVPKIKNYIRLQMVQMYGETDQNKYLISRKVLCDHAKIFGLENNPIINFAQERLEAERKKMLNFSRVYSNHRSLIHYHEEGKQGDGVSVIVLDRFLTPPADSGQILYHSRLDNKIPSEMREKLLERRPIVRNLKEGSHGIHIAGLIADENFGIAPEAHIIPIQIGTAYEPSSELVEKFLQGEKLKANIINMSFGCISKNHKFLSDMISDLKTLCKNHIVVEAAGNEGSAISKILSQAIAEDENLQKHLFLVSNVEKDGQTLKNSSCYFSEPEIPDQFLEDLGIAAPGSDIVSTIPECGTLEFNTKTGTSMAAGVVTGAIAKFMSDFPTFSITEIAQLIRAGANKNGVFADKGKYGQGFLDLERTYELAHEYKRSKG